jgi:hypothetical protein
MDAEESTDKCPSELPRRKGPIRRWRQDKCEEAARRDQALLIGREICSQQVSNHGDVVCGCDTSKWVRHTAACRTYSTTIELHFEQVSNLVTLFAASGFLPTSV